MTKAFDFEDLAYGAAMAKYCIKFKTMTNILKTENLCSIKDVVRSSQLS